MKKILFFVLSLALLWSAQTWAAPAQQIASATPLILTTEEGLFSLRAPAGWYLSSQDEGEGLLLIASPSPERASNPQGPGPLLILVYLDPLPKDESELLSQTLKDHGLAGLALQSSEITLWGLPAMDYQGKNESLRAHLRFIPLPDESRLIRVVILGSTDQWPEALAAQLLDEMVILPQVAKVPRGWPAGIRAPLGWEQKAFSSFAQWIAPADGPYAGLEIWFQAGNRAELIGQGEPGFVLRSLGVNYTNQVNQAGAYESNLGGLPAQALPFESFTHTGLAFSALGSQDPASNFGTANLVARAPLGTWGPGHQVLVEAIVASVTIAPPSPDSATVGLNAGYRPPPFSARYSDGTSFNLADYEGQLVVLHFWFADCPACRAEWPHLEALYQEYADRGLVLLPVNAIDPPAYIADFMDEFGYDFPLVSDPGGQLHQLYGVTVFPTSFIISSDGVILQAAKGMLSERSWRNLFEAQLGG